MTSDQDLHKRAAAEAALEYVPVAGTVGLGTGSTARYFIEGIGRLVAQGRQLRAVATSEQSRRQAASLGIPLLSDDGPWDIRVCVDGADEVSASLDLIKGGGAAHTREKIVNEHSRTNVIVVDETKLSQKLGEKWPVPLELLPFGVAATVSRLQRYGPLTRREGPAGPVLTDSGNFVYDLRAGVIESPADLDAELRAVPGVVETGLFCARADVVLVAASYGVRKLERR